MIFSNRKIKFEMSSIKQKMGICPECDDGVEKPITSGLCSVFHYVKHRQKVCKERAKKRQEENPIAVKVQKPIPKKSKKRIVEDLQYNADRKIFLDKPENKYCFIEGCGKIGNTIEHTAGRKGFADDWARENNISLYLDKRFWKACCWFHNGELERNPELSKKYQLSKITCKPKI